MSYYRLIILNTTKFFSNFFFHDNKRVKIYSLRPFEHFVEDFKMTLDILIFKRKSYLIPFKIKL